MAYKSRVSDAVVRWLPMYYRHLRELEKAGVVVPSLCRSGECSTCRTKLISGTVFHPGTELLRKADMRFGYIHPCVTYPVSDISILI